MEQNAIATSRRGFLGVVGAFVAAAAARPVMPQGFAKAKPIKEQSDLMAMLKDFRVQSFSKEFSIADVPRNVVTYRHAPGSPRTALDDMAQKESAGLLPIGVMVTHDYELIDVTALGDPQTFVDRPITIAEVTFG